MNNSEYQRGFVVYRKYRSRIAPFVKSKQATAFMMIILSLFTISFFGIFAIRPTLKTIVELNRQIQDAKQVNDTLQKKIDNLVKAQEEYQFIKEFVPQIDEALPNKPNIAYVVNKIENLTNDKGATISALDIGTVTYKKDALPEEQSPESISGATPVKISMQLNGTYASFSSFLDSLLKMRRTVTSNSLNIALDQVNKNTTLSLGLDLEAYYLNK